jgi:hypothetical protein
LYLLPIILAAVRSVRAGLAPACLLLAGALPAAAADTAWYTGARNQDAAQDYVVEMGTDLSVDSHGSIFGSVNGTMAPAGKLSEDGARIRLEASAGRYRYRSDTVGPVNATQVQGAALLGYSFVTAHASLSAFVGVDFQNNELSPFDPGNKVSGASTGAKFVVEGNMRPTDKTMLAGYMSYATSFNTYYARLQAGYRVMDRFYVGPEVGLLGNDFFNQWRVGAHLSGFALGPVKLSASAGYLSDDKQGSGFYTTVDLRAGF